MSKSTNLKVALTGNIGSGKSTFTNFVRDFAYPVISTDDISKEILANDSNVKEKIIKFFGARSFQGTEINKKYLADEVFSDTKKLKKINSILHPFVLIKLIKIIHEQLKSSKLVFVESALIYETKIEKMFDFIVLIVADEDIRMKRYISNKKSSKDDFIKREKNQRSQEVKKQKADFVFSNNGSTDELKSKAALLIKVLEGFIS